MDNQNNDVWIDRQEYERLKALEAQPQATVTTIDSGSITSTATQYPSPPVKASPNKLNFLTAVFAVMSFVFPPAILVFLGLGVVSFVKFIRGGASVKTKVGVGIATGVGVTLLLIVVGPFLLLFAIMIMWQIGCWTGLGSCTTA